ncbi:nucleoside-diphosphate kinase [Candidatus Sumerlaeota bacterium]|nr:nucleoside-diphosphate kinase [Candidatus Sumerlaeota bacterium]
MATEQSLILVKPDGVRRGLVGKIIARFERKGLKIAAMKMMRVTPELSDVHYAEHLNKGFYPELKSFITSGPIVAMVIEGDQAVALCRKLMGATKFTEAEPGTIRGDFAFSMTENLVHGSDSPASAAREIAIYFKDSEIMKGEART